MRSRALVPALLALACAHLAACGSSPNRPHVVATYPAHGQVLAGTLDEIRVEWNEPVTVLNPSDVEVFAGAGVVPVEVSQRAGEPTVLRIRPLPGSTFVAGEIHVVRLIQGLVVNEEDHYALDVFEFSFELGPRAGPFLADGAGAVVQLDPETLLEVTSTPTPGARVPVGVAGSAVDDSPLVWAQLATGGGIGEALAWFAPGAGAMTPVALLHAGGDLASDRASIALSQDGRSVLTAFRDLTAGRVRLSRVDVVSRTETDSILLSPAASPGTRPAGLVVTAGLVAVACLADAGDRLVFVDAATFTEVDHGPDAGVDGLPLPNGAGSLWAETDRVSVAPLAAVTAHQSLVFLGDFTVGESASTTVGAPTSLLLTSDSQRFVEGLAPPAAAPALLRRMRTDLASQIEIPVSDDVGGAPTGATAVTALVLYPGEPRFLVLLDSGAAARFSSPGTDPVQEDADLVTAGVQAFDLPASASDARGGCFLPGAVSP